MRDKGASWRGARNPRALREEVVSRGRPGKHTVLISAEHASAATGQEREGRMEGSKQGRDGARDTPLPGRRPLQAGVNGQEGEVPSARKHGQRRPRTRSLDQKGE